MKTIIFVFIIAFIATSQTTFGNEESVVPARRFLRERLDKVKTGLNDGFGNLQNIVTNTAEIVTNHVTNIIDGLQNVVSYTDQQKPQNITDIIVAKATRLIDTIASVTTNVVAGPIAFFKRIHSETNKFFTHAEIPLIRTLNGTNLGYTLNIISGGLQIGKNVLENLIKTMNQTFNYISDASENYRMQDFTIPFITLNANCSTVFAELQQNFTKTLIRNTKQCVHSAANGIINHLEKLDSIQIQLNSAFQIGRLRVGLVKEIKFEIRDIIYDLIYIQSRLPGCEYHQIVNSLSEITPIILTLPGKCFISFADEQ